MIYVESLNYLYEAYTLLREKSRRQLGFQCISGIYLGADNLAKWRQSKVIIVRYLTNHPLQMKL